MVLSAGPPGAKENGMPTAKRTTLIADACLVLVAVIWGSGFAATQYAIDSNMSPLLLNAIRMLVATAALGLLFWRDVRAMKKSDLKYGAAAGVLLFLAFFTQTTGLSLTTPSNNAFITATNVVMVPFLSWIFLKKRPKNRVFALAVLCIAGTALLSYTAGQGFRFNLGDLLTLLCAALFAGHIAFLELATRHTDARLLSVLQMAVAVLSCAALLAFDFPAIAVADYGRGLPALIYLGVFSTGLCFFLQTYAQRHTSGPKAAVILSMEGFFGCVFSVALGMEPVRWNMVVGGLIILTSVVLTEVDFGRKKAAPAPEGERAAP